MFVLHTLVASWLIDSWWLARVDREFQGWQLPPVLLLMLQYRRASSLSPLCIAITLLSVTAIVRDLDTKCAQIVAALRASVPGRCAGESP